MKGSRRDVGTLALLRRTVCREQREYRCRLESLGRSYEEGRIAGRRGARCGCGLRWWRRWRRNDGARRIHVAERDAIDGDCCGKGDAESDGRGEGPERRDDERTLDHVRVERRVHRDRDVGWCGDW